MFLNQMEVFDERKLTQPVFQAIHAYMQMVLEMLKYIRSTRTGNWAIPIEASDMFVPFFFAHNKLNYAQMTPLYLADMCNLQRSDPDIWD